MARFCSLYVLALVASTAMWSQTPACTQDAPASQAAAPPPVAPQPAPVAAAQTPSPAQNQAADDEPVKSAVGEPQKKDPKKKDNDKPVDLASLHHPVLWHDPGDIASLDLFYGQGGKDGQPAPPFKFDEEDMNGTNPKFDADDANGTKWRVKLGAEAKPEVVASRLLWAVGYYAEDDYVLAQADVSGIHMKRKPEWSKGGHIEDARFARKPHGEKKIGTWSWKENPFTGTRELSGLRVMMAVMNNWDLKDVNNAVFESKKGEVDIFLVSDVGATFGSNSLNLPIAKSKGDIGAFKGSKFITRETDTEVDFSTPAAPKGFLLKTAGTGIKEFETRKGFEWIGKNIPRADAKWIGSLLGQLSHDQLVAAFRAANFPPDQIVEYVTIVENRIAELKSL